MKALPPGVAGGPPQRGLGATAAEPEPPLPAAPAGAVCYGAGVGLSGREALFPGRGIRVGLDALDFQVFAKGFPEPRPVFVQLVLFN